MSGIDKTTGGVVDNYPITSTQVSNVYDVLTGDLAFDNIGLAKFGYIYASGIGPAGTEFGFRNNGPGTMQVKNDGESWSGVNGGFATPFGNQFEIQINDGLGVIADDNFTWDYTGVSPHLQVGDTKNLDTYISMSDGVGVIDVLASDGTCTAGDYEAVGSGSYLWTDDNGEINRVQCEGVIFIGDTDWASFGLDTFLEVNDNTLNKQISCSAAGGVIVKQLATGGSIDVGANQWGVLGTTVSDYRLKKNIEPIKDSLDKVSKLNGVNFEWKKENDNEKYIGLIAQEVEKVLPEVVFKKDDYYGINYKLLVSVLIEAVKERQKQIDNLKERLNKFD
jgi:hypothetical protein